MSLCKIDIADFECLHISIGKIDKVCAGLAGGAALVGLGGAALAWTASHRKTQIAIEHIYRARGASLTPWIFCINIGMQARLEEGCYRFADATGLNRLNDSEADMIVVNNAEDANVFFAPHQGAQTASFAGLS
jgi:hypothetical protein